MRLRFFFLSFSAWGQTGRLAGRQACWFVVPTFAVLQPKATNQSIDTKKKAMPRIDFLEVNQFEFDTWTKNNKQFLIYFNLFIFIMNKVFIS